MPEQDFQIIHKGREGVQPREPKYGRGENQRVWEVDYHGVKLGVNLGDIAAAPTEAIMCPTTPWLEVGGGGYRESDCRCSRRRVVWNLHTRIN